MMLYMHDGAARSFGHDTNRILVSAAILFKLGHSRLQLLDLTGQQPFL